MSDLPPDVQRKARALVGKGSAGHDTAPATPFVPANLGPSSPLLTASGARRKLRPTEKQVQAAVKRYYQLAGCGVYDLSQPRATMQTPGLPDLYVVSLEHHVAWWHEVKREGGRLSAAQIRFRDECAAVGARYVVGGLEVAELMVNEITKGND